MTRTTNHEDMVVPRMWRGDTRVLTNLSIDGECASTPSQSDEDGF